MLLLTLALEFLRESIYAKYVQNRTTTYGH